MCIVVIVGLTFDRRILSAESSNTTMSRGDPDMSRRLRALTATLSTARNTPCLFDAPRRRRAGLKMHKGKPADRTVRAFGSRAAAISNSATSFWMLPTAKTCWLPIRAAAWLRPYVGGEEMISGKWRWMPLAEGCRPVGIEGVETDCRAAGARSRRTGCKARPPAYRDYADYPTLFTSWTGSPPRTTWPYPKSPRKRANTSRSPWLPPTAIASNKLQIVPDAPLHYFGAPDIAPCTWLGCEPWPGASRATTAIRIVRL